MMREVRMTERKPRKFAKELRKNMTEAEHKLWSYLRRKNLDGYRFRRQHIIAPFIVDFVCVSEKLIIEVDGATHGEAAEITFDDKRTHYLEQQGWKIVRYGNEEVYKNTDDVLNDIYAHLKGLK